MDKFWHIVIFGQFELVWWLYVLILLGLTHISIISVTVFLHRHQAHRSLELHPAASHFFRFWIFFTTSIITKVWVAIHRCHHTKNDQQGDPHSPQVFGLLKVLFGGLILYRESGKDSAMIMKYGHGTPRDWIEKHVYTRRNNHGIVLLLLMQLYFFGLIGGLIWLGQMLWIPFWAAGVINGVGHWPLFKRIFCYRNWDTPDASVNIIPWGVITGGEELHNNHHAFPSSAKLSVKWYELDLGWMYIRVLELLHLATVKKSLPVKLRDKLSVDERTITLIRGDLGFVRGAYYRLLAFVTKRELKDNSFSPTMRVHLEELKFIFASRKWNSDVATSARYELEGLKGSGSLLPLLGEFLGIFADIKAPATEVHTTPEREHALITRLDAWVSEVRTESVPRGEAFVRMLCSTVLKQSSRA